MCITVLSAQLFVLATTSVSGQVGSVSQQSLLTMIAPDGTRLIVT